MPCGSFCAARGAWCQGFNFDSGTCKLYSEANTLAANDSRRLTYTEDIPEQQFYKVQSGMNVSAKQVLIHILVFR